MPSPESILVYTTHPISKSDQTNLLELLNRPNRQFTEPYNLPDLLELATSPHQIGKSVDQLIEIHKQWVSANDIDVNTTLGASIFLIADDKAIPGATPPTVLVVNTLEAEGSKTDDELYQSFRVPISSAAGMLTAIDGGQSGWEGIYDVQRHGGVLPCPDDESVE